MDILILNWKDIKNPTKGGAEVIAFEFAKRLAKEGHKVTFFSRNFTGASPEEIIDGVKVIRRGNFLSVYLEAYWYYKSLNKKPDKVIDMVNTICWQTPLYVSKQKRLMYVNQLAKEVFFYELPWSISWIAYLLEKMEYLSYKKTKVVCYSKSTQNDLRSFGIPLKNISLFPLGVDHARYMPGKKKSTTPLFLFVARLVKMKRSALCIQAMKKVIKKYPHAQLIIMGNGPEEQNLINLINSLKLKKNVSLITKNNFYLKKSLKDIKVSYMQKAWALLLPSVKEGWGMVVTEAAACGTPAVVSDVTGLRDSVIANKTGYTLSKNPSADELADSMIAIIDNRGNATLSQNAVKWARNFTWDKSYKKFKKHVFS